MKGRTTVFNYTLVTDLAPAATVWPRGWWTIAPVKKESPETNVPSLRPPWRVGVARACGMKEEAGATEDIAKKR